MPKRLAERDSTVTTRRAALKALSGVTAVGAAGCLGGDGDTSTPSPSTGGVTGTPSSGEWPDLSGTELHFLYGQPSEEAQQYFRGIASDFEDATGAETNLEFTGIDNLNNRVTQLLQSNSPPELVATNSQFAPTYANQGILRPLTGVVDTLTDRYGGMTTGSRLTYDGEDRYVPLWANPQMFFYRSDLSDTVPDTWDNLLAYAEEVEANEEVQHGNYQPAGTGSDDFWHLASFAYTNDVSIVERRNGNIVATMDQGQNRSRWVEVLEFFDDRYQYSPDTTDSSWSGALNSIPQGIAGSSWYGGARIINEVNRQDSEFAEAVDVTWPEGRSRTFTGGTDGFVSFEGSNGDAADAFLKFMTQAEYLAPIYWTFSNVHNAPVYPGIKESNTYQKELENLLETTTWTREEVDFYQETAVEEMNFVANDTDPAHPYVGTIISSNSLQNMVAEVLVNDQDPEDAIDTYTRELQDVLDDAQG